MSIGAISGLTAYHLPPIPPVKAGSEKGESGVDHDGDSDDGGAKASALPPAGGSSSQGLLLNVLA